MDPNAFSMPFGDHLEELRRRLMFALLGPIPIFVVSLFYGGQILDFLVAPAETQLRAAGLPVRMLAASPAEPFTAYLKVAMVVAVLVSAPWILYQVWLFVAPGLYSKERRFAYFLFPASTVLTATGMAFLYYVLLPVMLRFFIIFGSMVITTNPATAPLPEGLTLPTVPVLTADPVQPTPGDLWMNENMNELRLAVPTGDALNPVRVMGVPLSGGGVIDQHYRIGEYVSLVFNLGIVFALAFQLPLVLMLGEWVGVLDHRALAKLRRYALFACAVVGAIFTPADPGSMVLLAIPLYALFEFGLLLMRFVPASRVAGAADPSEGPDSDSREGR